jgi:flagellum-specific ATP synthase
MLDGLGEPMDGGPKLELTQMVPVNAPPPNAVTRSRITEPLQVGVRALDGLLTIGKGQRMGIFAGSGVGKSTLMGMIARSTAADVNVIALVGERGREVRDFVEESLGIEGVQRSVVVVATSDQPALLRIKAALVATAIAEHFRDRGADVMLMMDSVTRLAMAQREVGLAIGEPPATRGYTPSVFALLPRLLERAGTSSTGSGSITGLYTVLVEGDDMNEPVADAVRGILDGHIVLSRELAHRSHYPAIDVLQSVSRVMPQITYPEQRSAADQMRETLATYKSAEDLINIGAYVAGSNPKIDRARAKIETVNSFLRQHADEPSQYVDTLRTMLTQFPPGQ